MEPMTLGSPGTSPNTSTFLPAFLMGETQEPKTPRNNTLSPNKGGRIVSFATSLGASTPQDYNRTLEHRTPFGSQQTPQQASGGINNYPSAQTQLHNVSTAGPPIQGLFDSLHEELSQIPTPNRPLYYGTPVQSHNKSGYGMNSGYDQPSLQNASQFNDSPLNYSSVNVSRGIVSPLGLKHPRNVDFWVTVFGFPPTARTVILTHFAECGTILEHVFPQYEGNWVHIRYSSRKECDKAINYNSKILGKHTMIGVTNFNDGQLVDRENFCNNNARKTNIRSLANTGYDGTPNESVIQANISMNAPQKSTGIMNKAMEMLFGW